MNLGCAQRDITPEPGIELAGFAVRPQPSTRVHDRLIARALCLEAGPERLLWLHADVLAFDQALADRVRADIGADLGLDASRVFLSASHTHSGPATIGLTGCGEIDPAYVRRLEKDLHLVARGALSNLEPCRVRTAQGRCDLAADRRNQPSAHTDPRVGVVGWARPDGTFKAVFLNYSMHPVCLRDTLISADWPGAAARALAASLPGNPAVFATPGACGNVNPPAVGVSPEQMTRWGSEVAEHARRALTHLPEDATPDTAHRTGLRVAARTVDIPVEAWGPEAIHRHADTSLAEPGGHREFGDKFRRAVEAWRSTMLERYEAARATPMRAELAVVHLGPAVLALVNAELFSRFGDLVAPATPVPVYPVTCANGMLGYASTLEAYAEGTYEVLWSPFFYNLPRLRAGCLELLADHTRALIAEALASDLACR